MLLECFDGDFRLVSSMDSRWYQFILACFCNKLFHSRGAFIIKDMFCDGEFSSLDPCDNSTVCPLHFLITLIFHRLFEGVVTVLVENHHDILVSSAGAAW